ncbi:MAG TPA: HIT family protein [Actinomycetota bacterium]|nr:HIT family protein [Actinomycetota bacterium]
MCLFCDIATGRTDAHVVLDDELCMAFLDHRPLFPGHSLLIPKDHYETLADLPHRLLTPLFANAQLLSLAVEQTFDARGSFVGINNKVSQSVPHLHIHVVPRRPKDGLRGFFWPRSKYSSEQDAADIATRLRATVEALR